MGPSHSFPRVSYHLDPRSDRIFVPDKRPSLPHLYSGGGRLVKSAGTPNYFK